MINFKQITITALYFIGYGRNFINDRNNKNEIHSLIGMVHVTAIVSIVSLFRKIQWKGGEGATRDTSS